MEAGPEMDRLVAEIVMRWTLPPYSSVVGQMWVEPTGRVHPEGLPHFSTDIAAAWQVVEHLTEMGFSVNIGCGWYDVWSRTTYGVTVKDLSSNAPTPFHQDVRTTKEGGICLAICNAALKAVAKPEK